MMWAAMRGARKPLVTARSRVPTAPRSWVLAALRLLCVVR